MPSAKKAAASKPSVKTAKLAKGWGDLPVACLTHAEWNYKTDEPKKQAKLVQNISRNGQVETIIVRELAGGKFEVVNGNHRLDAFKELGIGSVHVFNLGKVTLAMAKRIAVETNETKFDPDKVKLATTIRDMREEFGIEDLELTMPYDADQFKAFAETLEFNWSDEPQSGKGSRKQKSTVTGFRVTFPASFTSREKAVLQEKLASVIGTYPNGTIKLEDLRE